MSGELSPEESARLADFFGRAAELAPDERATFLERECGASPALREELERLLATLEGEDVLDRLQSSVAASLESRSGTRVGPYELLERIGEGGMGDVYAALQSDPVRRRVALKVIKPGMDSAQVVARFDAERQALARMSHPNVAQVFDGGATDDGNPYFAMELVEGEPITLHCDRHELTTRARLELFLGVCDGVQHAHQKGIIHRDLKPSNLLVALQDGHALPKVIDFGVARATTGSLADRSLHTMLGQLVGTLDYMSPEQADPTSADLDTRSDVYSLGVVLYQLVSGLLPFESASQSDLRLSEIQRAIREEDPPTPSTRLRRQFDSATAVAPRHGTDGRALIRQLTGDLDWICMKALEKDPARRYQSVSELAEDVRRHLAFEPVLAGRPGALYRLRKYVRRHRVGVTAGLLVAAVAITGAFGVVSARLDAAAKGAQLRKLEDRGRLQELVAKADSAFWPPHPEGGRLAAMESWVERARALLSNKGGHERDLRALRRRALPRAADADEEQATWRFSAYDDQLLHDWLAELVVGLERLEADLLDTSPLGPEQPVGAHGWSVPQRIEYARGLEAGYAEGGTYSAAWSAALPAMRADYPGLELGAFQMGLFPLGRDVDSGLWEFAHLMSGAPAERDETGQLVLTDETGLVLVLLPAGTFDMGAQKEDPSGPNYDPDCSPALESPVVIDVEVPAFFLSKYEMTRGQWTRFVEGRNTKFIPMSMVTWNQCDTTMRRLGLMLPSEVQWEYAARGGTIDAWWKGAESNGGHIPANLLDLSTLEFVPRWEQRADYVDWDDGFRRIAPPGTFDPNPFGFHNMLGNVSEWTSSHPGPLGADDAQQRGKDRYVSRGGNLMSGPSTARPSFRGFSNVGEFAIPALGLRPARELDAPR